MSVKLLVNASTLLFVGLSVSLGERDTLSVMLNHSACCVIKSVDLSVVRFGFRGEVFRSGRRLIEEKPGKGVEDGCLTRAVVAVYVDAFAVGINTKVLDSLKVF